MLIKGAEGRSLGYIQQLMQMARKSNRKQSEQAIYALRDVFSQDVLKDDNKLQAFQKNERIASAKSVEDVPNFDLIDAYYDHCIKELYRDFVSNLLVNLSRDDLEYYRKMALDILGDLIQRKPEIEDVILSILINKLGDNARKVQLHAMMVLCRVLKNHP